MTSSRRFLCMLSACALVFSMCVCLAGCGKQPAATWAHGDVSEDEVTSSVNNLRSNYGITDDASWATFVKQRSYDTSDQTDDSSNTSAISQATENSSSSGNVSDELLGANVAEANSEQSAETSSETATSEEKAVDESGTVEDLRSYVIEQIVRQRIIDEEIEKRNITVSDGEVDDYVNQVRAYVESQYMSGVFESFLQMQGYADLNAYREEARTQLIQAKLQKEIASTTAEDGTESIDQKKWNEWLDGMYAYAEVKINPAPSNLSYAISETSSSSSSSSSSAGGDSSSSSSDSSSSTEPSSSSQSSSE